MEQPRNSEKKMTEKLGQLKAIRVMRHRGSFVGATCLLLSLSLLLQACQPKAPKDVFKTPENAMKMRSLQSRGYDTKDEKKILSASAAALQDMGFTMDDSESKLGLVVASKDADASDKAQVALVTGGLVLCALAGGGVSTRAYDNLDDIQKVRASVVTNPGQSKKNTVVRVTFQRVVYNRAKQISKMETLQDPKLYQGFFDRLSKSVFLEEHQI